ncbi:hypothetical protein WN55_09202 [Dufourea novaeangliae]|uniref:Uncharacterized protein n=1 Tax=Dufourea novaeangliae TaxID=178035 RepID=A0A154PAP5_DUFNO|nr:hypothetical protein WN55_09202 [Dufourea novaeangliae]
MFEDGSLENMTVVIVLQNGTDYLNLQFVLMLLDISMGTKENKNEPDLRRRTQRPTKGTYDKLEERIGESKRSKVPRRQEQSKKRSCGISRSGMKTRYKKKTTQKTKNGTKDGYRVVERGLEEEEVSAVIDLAVLLDFWKILRYRFDKFIGSVFRGSVDRLESTRNVHYLRESFTLRE